MRRWRLAALPLFVALALSACNSTDAVLTPSAPPPLSAVAGDASTEATGTSSTNAQQVAVLPAASPPAATLDAQAAALSQPVRVQFAPIVGATVEAVTPLTRRLSLRAAQRGIGLTASGDPETTHMMKGYFSALSDGGETTVIYVWDVLDPAGNRLHRIQGQERVTDASADGWQGVPAETMETVGDLTIDQLADWLAARKS